MPLTEEQRAMIEQKRKAALARREAAKKEATEKEKEQRADAGAHKTTTTAVHKSSNTNKSYSLDTGGHVNEAESNRRIQIEDFDRIADEIKNKGDEGDDNSRCDGNYGSSFSLPLPTSKKSNAYNGAEVPKATLLSSIPPPPPSLAPFLSLHPGSLIPQTLALSLYLIPLSSLRTLNYTTSHTQSTLKSPPKLYSVQSVAQLSFGVWKDLRKLEDEKGKRETKKLKNIKDGILGKRKGEGGKFGFKGKKRK
ncbi:hypothetical protein TrVE_jg5493 [Triparma verrucosa]|uniref:Uncharacterized protein n=1 Tax=Triparma verrucosa TaxID=1606542 RepID=A0A9W7FMB1_9STRA|nr:hypothetical protein TrVE_jg5493 [Triparma verrucosa]